MSSKVVMQEKWNHPPFGAIINLNWCLNDDLEVNLPLPE
jgi:hypothetical protein